MPPVNWNTFESLPGSVEYNFEMLCRALIRRHYAQYGEFAGLAAQPGVEFHLKLDRPCSLGIPGQWYGWQCRWYDLPSGRAIGKTRRDKIAKAIMTTEKEVPGITDWVLWTRHALTKGDQVWFKGLRTHMRLHLWTSAEVEEHLSGDADVLRGSYFGELILTPASLTNIHDQAVAPIRRRWQPEVHQTIDAERSLKRMLGEIRTWDILRNLAGQLQGDAIAIDADLTDLTGLLADSTAELARLVRTAAAALGDAHIALGHGDLDSLRLQLATHPVQLGPELVLLPRQLRANRKRAALTVTNGLASVREARRLLDKLDICLGTRSIAILADAGCGKTELAAQLTAAAGDRPAGILLHGRELHAGHNLDDLARNVIIQGNPVSSMEKLVAAVDAAGQRAHKRLPIVIDGLNEAEDPRNWKNLLASLDEVLRQYPYVLVVCTVRTAFVNETLPTNGTRLEIPGFEHDTVKAIRRYFDHYRINATDMELPWELLSHPLTLRLFCEVTNMKREREVGVEAMPGSLTALFERYLEQAAERIAELAPRTWRYYEQDVRTALDKIGIALWEENARSLDVAELRRRLGEDGRPWDQSIIRALEHDGVLLRVPEHQSNAVHIAGVYDALAGHLIASAILARQSRIDLAAWLREPNVVTALAGPLSERHPLAADTFHALVGLVPRLHHQQLWPLLNGPLRTIALHGAAYLEGANLNAQTVDELAKLVIHPPVNLRNLFERLWQTRGAPTHPLNAEFLDTVLRPMAMTDRDLRWTEWVRRNHNELLTDIQRLENRWRKTVERPLSDRLRARWVMYLLTSTVRELRDWATRTLYWFGRGDPTALFDLTLDALTINDSYISERMLAASYGVAMALHCDFANERFKTDVLPSWGIKLYSLMFEGNAPHGTTHILSRDYARRTIDIALFCHANLLSDDAKSRINPPYQGIGIREWGESENHDSGRYSDGDAPLHMDFENYTLGYLVDNRSNYDFDNEEYRKIRANIYWRLYDLGYTFEQFGSIDKIIAGSRYYRDYDDQSRKIDRYGKKYSWIAFFEMAGYLADRELPKKRDYNERIAEADIDPSFPEEPRDYLLIPDNLLGDADVSTQEWIDNGSEPPLERYLVFPEVSDESGPWVLLDGYINQENEELSRNRFTFVRCFLVRAGEFDKVYERLAEQDLGGRWLPEIPESDFTFAGEIPWCETFVDNEWSDMEFIVGSETLILEEERLQLYRDGISLTEEEQGQFFDDIAKIIEKKDTEALEKELQERNLVIGVGPYKREVQQERKDLFQVLIPVREYNWRGEQSRANSAHSATVLAKQIARALGLRGQAQTFDLFDDSGRRATMLLRHGVEHKNSQHFIYIRQDLLNQYLQMENLSVIWAVWGERQYVTSKMFGLGSRYLGEGPKPWCVFQKIYRYGKVAS